MKHTICLTWLVFLSAVLNSEIIGTDVGYRCDNDLECKEGNGGNFARCDSISSRCLCTHDIRGEESNAFDGNELSCDLDNVCIKKETCMLKCLPKDMWRFDSNEDWYGHIAEPFTSLFVEDEKTSVCYDPDRATNSRPKNITIKASGIPKAGLGAFTETYVPRGTVIGPYKGYRIVDGNYNEHYSWKIVEGNSKWRVDASNRSFSNWLRYINCPNTPEMENLFAVQYEGEIYYYAFKSIRPGSELLVYYGDQHAKDLLGIMEYKSPVQTFGQAGNAGGLCLQKQDSPPRCNHIYTTCIGGLCMCIPGTSFRAGICVADEGLGGKCRGRNGDQCKNDKNAECWEGVCVCNKKSTAVYGWCAQDETYGGVCSGQNGKNCLLDKNAECSDGVCNCKYGTNEVLGKCIMDNH